MTSEEIRLDHSIIYSIIGPETRVLDLGCGEGDLLYPLVRDKQVLAQGIELDDKAIQECVKKGLSVFHDDIEHSLREYPVKNVDFVIHEALRIGSRVIVGFPNFAFIRSRFMLFIRGKAPITKSLPYLWFDTPNVRFLSIDDFRDFCAEKNIRIIEAHYLGERRIVHFWPNLLALNAIFVLAKGIAKEA
jgi:methionine biosynthesis protein MetW